MANIKRTVSKLGEKQPPAHLGEVPAFAIFQSNLFVPPLEVCWSNLKQPPIQLQTDEGYLLRLRAS